jgi:hypothetical protein
MIPFPDHLTEHRGTLSFGDRNQVYNYFLLEPRYAGEKVPSRMNPQDGGISGGFYICHSQRNFRERRRWKGRKKKKRKKGKKLRASMSTRQSSLPSASTRKDSRPARTRFSHAKTGPFFPVHPRPSTASPKPGPYDAAQCAESFNIDIARPEGSQMAVARARKCAGPLGEKGSGGSAIIPWENQICAGCSAAGSKGAWRDPHKLDFFPPAGILCPARRLAGVFLPGPLASRGFREVERAV